MGLPAMLRSNSTKAPRACTRCRFLVTPGSAMSVARVRSNPKSGHRDRCGDVRILGIEARRFAGAALEHHLRCHELIEVDALLRRRALPARGRLASRIDDFVQAPRARGGERVDGGNGAGHQGELRAALPRALLQRLGQPRLGKRTDGDEDHVDAARQQPRHMVLDGAMVGAFHGEGGNGVEFIERGDGARRIAQGRLQRVALARALQDPADAQLSVAAKMPLHHRPDGPDPISRTSRMAAPSSRRRCGGDEVQDLLPEEILRGIEVRDDGGVVVAA